MKSNSLLLSFIIVFYYCLFFVESFLFYFSFFILIPQSLPTTQSPEIESREIQKKKKNEK